MEFSIIHSIVSYTVITVLNFSTYNSAYWLIPPYGPPAIPDSNESKTCTDWIIHYGFGQNTVLNRTMAQNRAQQYDDYVSVWAVMYAQVLLAFPAIGVFVNGNFSYLPVGYCRQYNNVHFPDVPISWPFQTFMSTLKSCEEWIHLYSYYLDDRYRLNWDHAYYRNKYEDDNISVWAAGYARYIKRRKQKDVIAPYEYCSGMGLSYYHEMNFMSYNGTIKSCREWIELSEYENSTDSNRVKFREQRENYKRFKNYINTWTKLYFKHLRKFFAPKQNAFGCASSSTCDPDRRPMTPAQFCESEGLNDDVPLTYFHEIIVDDYD